MSRRGKARKRKRRQERRARQQEPVWTVVTEPVLTKPDVDIEPVTLTIVGPAGSTDR